MIEKSSPQPITDDVQPLQNFEEIFLTKETMFNLFSIFFISTVSFIIFIMLAATNFRYSIFGQELFLLPFSIFFGGYLVVFDYIVIYYIVRFSKAVRSIYERNERTVKIAALFIVVLTTAIVGSILSVNQDLNMQIIGTAISVFVVALMFIIIDPVIVSIKQKVNDWINRKSD